MIKYKSYDLQIIAQGYYIIMKKYILVCLAFFFSTLAFAQDKEGWQVELKKISLDVNSTDVKNATEYKDFPNSKLSADSQRLVQGYLNLYGDYYANKYVWGNNLLMEYGKSTIIPEEGERVTSESVDRILLTSAFNCRLWKVDDFLGGFEAGPYASLTYQTEFRANNDAARKQALRYASGMKIFDGKFIKNFYLAPFVEREFTRGLASTKLGWETGVQVDQPLREGVKLVYTGTFRNYLSYSTKTDTDIDYELELDARMEVEVFKRFSVAPFINFYTAQARDFGARGQNLYVGVSFSFGHTFLAASKPLPPPTILE